MIRHVRESFFVETVQLELNIAHLYKIFSSMFSRDRKFWLEMSNQELVNAKMVCLLEDKFMDSIEYLVNTPNIERIHSINSHIAFYSSCVETENVSRKEAFDIALNLEHEVYELEIRDVLDNLRVVGVKDIFTCVLDKERVAKARLMTYLKENYV